MSAQQIPRSQQRDGWDPDMHLRQLDNDIDGLEAGINNGLERLASEMAKNRATMWKVLGLVVSVVGLGIGIVTLILNASAG